MKRFKWLYWLLVLCAGVAMATPNLKDKKPVRAQRTLPDNVGNWIRDTLTGHGIPIGSGDAILEGGEDRPMVIYTESGQPINVILYVSASQANSDPSPVPSPLASLTNITYGSITGEDVYLFPQLSLSPLDEGNVAKIRALGQKAGGLWDIVDGSHKTGAFFHSRLAKTQRFHGLAMYVDFRFNSPREFSEVSISTYFALLGRGGVTAEQQHFRIHSILVDGKRVFKGLPLQQWYQACGVNTKLGALHRPGQCRRNHTDPDARAKNCFHNQTTKITFPQTEGTRLRICLNNADGADVRSNQWVYAGGISEISWK